MRLLLITFVCIAIVACSKRKSDVQTITPNSFPITASLIGEPIKIEDKVLYPMACCTTDSLLILFDEKSSKFLKFYSKKSFELIRSYGRIGSGPGEYTVPNENSLKITKCANRNYLWLQDAKHLTRIDIDSLLQDNEYSPQTIYPLIPDLSPYNSLFLVNDSLAVGNSSIPKVQLFNWNVKTDIHSHKNFYPKGNFKLEELSSPYYSSVFNGTMDHNHNYLVFAYLYFNHIEIIDIQQNKHLKRISLTPNKVITIDIRNGHPNLSENKVFFTDIKITSSYIFALGWGIVEYSIMENKDSFPILFVFRTTGEPVAKYKLDKKMFKFCVSPDEKSIFGITPMEETNTPFVKYILSEPNKRE